MYLYDAIKYVVNMALNDSLSFLDKNNHERHL